MRRECVVGGACNRLDCGGEEFGDAKDGDIGRMCGFNIGSFLFLCPSRLLLAYILYAAWRLETLGCGPGQSCVNPLGCDCLGECGPGEVAYGKCPPRCTLPVSGTVINSDILPSVWQFGMDMGAEGGGDEDDNKESVDSGSEVDNDRWRRMQADLQNWQQLRQFQ